MRNFIVMLSLVSLLCSSCGTVAGHDDQGTMGGVDHGVYRGVRTDWQWIAHGEPEERLGWPLYLIDTPFSFVADTLLLPFDAMGVTAGTRQPEAK
jgi:uncharacterized protein YceK